MSTIIMFVANLCALCSLRYRLCWRRRACMWASQGVFSVNTGDQTTRVSVANDYCTLPAICNDDVAIRDGTFPCRDIFCTSCSSRDIFETYQPAPHEPRKKPWHISAERPQTTQRRDRRQLASTKNLALSVSPLSA